MKKFLKSILALLMGIVLIIPAGNVSADESQGNSHNHTFHIEEIDLNTIKIICNCEEECEFFSKEKVYKLETPDKYYDKKFYDLVYFTGEDGLSGEDDELFKAAIKSYSCEYKLTTANDTEYNSNIVDAGSYCVRVTNKDNSDGSLIHGSFKFVKTFEIYKRNVTVVAGSATKAYDGEPLTCNTYTIIEDDSEGYGFVDGEGFASVAMTTESTITNPGTAENVINPDLCSAKPGTNPINYSIIYENGVLEVTKVPCNEVPEGLVAVKPSHYGLSDGAISGTSPDMEYSTDSSFANAIDCTDDETTGLAAGLYYVRYKETEYASAGSHIEVVVPAGDKDKFSVTVTSDGHGSVSADIENAEEGTTVSLTAVPESGYHFKSWASEDVTIEGNSFTMPSKNVNVKAIFEEDEPEPVNYTVTVTSDGNGTASADKSEAAEGAAITLTATANTGYHFKGWETEDVAVNNNSFTMPSKNVSVKAVFEKDAEEPKEGDPNQEQQEDNGGSSDPVTPSEPVTPTEPVTPSEPVIIIVPSQGGNSDTGSTSGNTGSEVTPADTGKNDDTATSADAGKADTADTSESTDSTSDSIGSSEPAELSADVENAVSELSKSRKGADAAKLLEELFATDNTEAAADSEKTSEVASKVASVEVTETSPAEADMGSLKGGVFKTPEGETIKNSFVESTKTGRKYFADENGNKVTNTIVTDGEKLYYCNSKGVVQTNKAIDLGNGQTVLVGKTGAIVTKSDARVSVGGKSYITGENGVVQKNAVATISVKTKKNGKTVTVERTYFTDENGVVMTGVIERDGKTYITSATGIVRKNKITKVNGKKIYTDKNGEVVKNATVKYNGKTYKANEKGILS